MSTPLTVECKVEFRRLAKGRKQMQDAPATPRPMVPPGRVPRVSRWMALALRCERLLCEGHIASHAELARLGQVTHARISQIMNLLYLAPDIQETILFLPRTECGRDPIILRDLQPIAAKLGWREQREMWEVCYTPSS
ncbi:MAG TPA: hypothetical protein VH643_33530 [Gemmataceae bacterium]